MSILQYPKHQYVFEVDGEASVLHFIPSFTGYLKHIRVKMMKRNYAVTDAYAIINIIANADTTPINKTVIATSERVYYKDIGNASNPNDYYHAWVRFNFSENILLSGIKYTISIVQTGYTSLVDSFVGFCLDYNFPVNKTIEINSPFTNTRLAAEIYLLKDYYEFD